MAYEAPTLDTSTRQKLLGMLDTFYNVPQNFAMIQGAGQNALRQNFDAAQERIGAQFAPVQRMATARLAGSPLLADSGYANRLNRQIQTSAFGDLSRAYGQSSADNANSQLSALERLLQARFQGTQQLLGGVQEKKKGSAWGTVGSVVGAGAGALIGGPAGAYAGYQAGSQF